MVYGGRRKTSPLILWMFNMYIALKHNYYYYYYYYYYYNSTCGMQQY